MNKKEVSEIRKQFKTDNGLFTLCKMANAYITDTDEIDFFEIRYFDRLPENEQDLYMHTFKKTLTGALGKVLLECKFAENAYDEDGGQSLLNNLLTSELKDEDKVKSFIERIKDKLALKEKYFISLIHCQYSVPPETGKKKTMDEGEVIDYTDFDFLLCSINAMKLTEIGLYFNNDDRVVEKKTNFDTEVLKGPFAGFMYPTFSGRAADINNVMIFTKNMKEPNVTLIKDVLNAEYEITCNEELEKFTQVIREVCGEDLEFDIGKKIYSQLNQIIERNCVETEQPTVGYKEIENILVNSGVDVDVAKEVENAFEDIFEDKDIQLKVVNLTNETKTVVKTADASISIKASETDSIETRIIDGRKCLVIPLLENTITINDIDVQ